MSRSRRYRMPFVVTVASTLVACGGNTASDSGGSGNAGGSGAVSGSGGSGNAGGFGAVSGSGGSGNAGGTTSSCPASFPDNGASCVGSSGLICNYDQGQCCPPWQASCVDEKWQAYASSCNPPPPDPCPFDAPVNGTSCGPSDPCGGSYQYCTYGKCADDSPHTIAECQGGVWKVSQSNCALPACDTLTPCDCFDRADCKALTDTCLCECDYACPGKPPCDCSCGGGAYLGCAPI